MIYTPADLPPTPCFLLLFSQSCLVISQDSQMFLYFLIIAYVLFPRQYPSLLGLRVRNMEAITEKTMNSLFGPTMTRVRSPPSGFKGDPELGVAFYYCSEKPCDSIWGVYWKDFGEQPRELMTLPQHQALATAEVCTKCAWYVHMQKTLENVSQNIAKATPALYKTGEFLTDDEIDRIYLKKLGEYEAKKKSGVVDYFPFSGFWDGPMEDQYRRAWVPQSRKHLRKPVPLGNRKWAAEDKGGKGSTDTELEPELDEDWDVIEHREAEETWQVL
ncbi:hypothetical protein ABEF92_008701 [Exophiala dermatitidis]|nr:hypothetical protein HRR76_008060 [Exophiala dermatitidis]KAJ4669925.1 hypothetical protein HRR95_007347 [Exophiala dermatitidis]